MSNIVYIGTSLDGYIAAADGGLDWLSCVPVPKGEDLGFAAFMERVDAVVMGRKTFETLLGFGMGWHYPKPGIVLSSTLRSLPAELADRVEIASGTPGEIVRLARSRGFENLYIDGGRDDPQVPSRGSHRRARHHGAAGAARRRHLPVRRARPAHRPRADRYGRPAEAARETALPAQAGLTPLRSNRSGRHRAQPERERAPPGGH